MIHDENIKTHSRSPKQIIWYIWSTGCARLHDWFNIKGVRIRFNLNCVIMEINCQPRKKRYLSKIGAGNFSPDSTPTSHVRPPIGTTRTGIPIFLKNKNSTHTQSVR